jgi:hypothetical protein
MPGERKQRYAHYERHVHPDPRAKRAALQIAAQIHDNGVDHVAMDDDCAQGRCEPHKQGIKYVARHHLACCEPHDGSRVLGGLVGSI